MRAIRDPLSAIRLSVLILAAFSQVTADVSDRLVRVISILPGTPVSAQITIGSLVVSGWDRNEVSVEIVRRAGTIPQLSLIPAEVEHGAAGVVIRAVQADGGHDAGLRTDVVLRMPRLAELRDVAMFEGRVELAELRGACSVRVERGEIAARQLSGRIRLETAIGSIRLSGATVTTEGMMRLRTFNGDVALELATIPVHARILALSMGGRITSDIPLTHRQRWGPRFAEATLGSGEPVVSIDAVNGNVAITVAGAKR
jgi:hypothetical protein